MLYATTLKQPHSPGSKPRSSFALKEACGELASISPVDAQVAKLKDGRRRVRPEIDPIAKHGFRIGFPTQDHFVGNWLGGARFLLGPRPCEGSGGQRQVSRIRLLPISNCESLPD